MSLVYQVNEGIPMVARNVSTSVVTIVWQKFFVSFFLNEESRNEDDNETHNE